MPSVYEGLGIEDLVDAIDMVLRDKFDAALAYQQAKGDIHDQQRADALGLEWTQLVLEPVPASNFHAGSLPSFIQSDDREENYPLVATVMGRIAPDPEDISYDQIGVVQDFVSVHVFAKANDPNLSWRKAARMAEAAYQIMTTDRRICGKIQRKTPNNVIFSEPWLFYANGEDHGSQLARGGVNNTCHESAGPATRVTAEPRGSSLRVHLRILSARFDSVARES
jgi:hypothetical protein